MALRQKRGFAKQVWGTTEYTECIDRPKKNTAGQHMDSSYGMYFLSTPT